MIKLIGALVTIIISLWLGIYVGIYSGVVGIIKAINLYPPINGGLVALSIVKIICLPTVAVWLCIIIIGIILTE